MKLSTNATNAAARVARWTDHAALLDGTADVRSHGAVGGTSHRSLRRIASEYALGRCIGCKQVTSLTVPAWSPEAATTGLLIPASMFGASGLRLGYGIKGGPSNVGSFCRACLNLTTQPHADGTVHVWTPDVIDAWCILPVMPSLPKTRGVAVVTESLVDVANHYAESRRVLALRGVVTTS
jgi:hypothetical protein